MLYFQIWHFVRKRGEIYSLDKFVLDCAKISIEPIKLKITMSLRFLKNIDVEAQELLEYFKNSQAKKQKWGGINESFTLNIAQKVKNFILNWTVY